MIEAPEEQQDISKVPKQLQPFAYKKGQSGNPAGRPPGKTLKEYTRDMLAAMTDDERQEFLEGIPKEAIWKMSEGNPKNEQGVTLKIDKIKGFNYIIPE